MAISFNVRKITDPHYGRGISATISIGSRTYDFCPSIGLTDKLVGLSLIVSPPFSPENINEGDDTYTSDLKEVSLKVSLLWVIISLPFYTYNHTINFSFN
jgi:hypothetical protein